MPLTPTSTVHRQVARASRRLFVQTLLDHLVWCWAGALLVAALWFLAQPWIVDAADAWLRWAVAAGLFAGGTGLAIVLAARQAPSLVVAALEVDQRFQLKERVTSSLTLPEHLRETPAGQALAADADQHAAKLDVAGRFPVRLSWSSAAVPAAAVVLALVALFYNPVFDQQNTNTARPREEITLTNAKEIEQKFNNLKKPTSFKFTKEEMDAKQEEIEKLWDKLLKEPLDTNDQNKVREKLQQMVPLEEKIKERIDDLKAQQQRNKEMEKQLQEMGKDADQKLQKDGPGDGVENALNKGDIDKAKKELDKLADKLQNDKLTKEDKEKLQKQLDEMQQKLQDVADQKKQLEDLQKKLDEGKLTKEEFDKLKEQAGDKAKDMKDLKEIGKKLAESKDALEKGDNKGAADKLKDAAKDMQKLDSKDRELQQMQEREQQLQDLRNEMQQGLGRPNDQPPNGQRPVAKDGKTGSKDEKQFGHVDPKADPKVVGQGKGGTFNKIPSNQVGGHFEQAQQQSPEAIERQQVPQDAVDFLKGYYENLGGSKRK